jgi:hypothetical protein
MWHFDFEITSKTSFWSLLLSKILRFLNVSLKWSNNIGNSNLFLKYGFFKKVFLQDWTSDQLNISFVKIRFSFYQNIGETLIQFKKSVSPRLDPPVIKTITGGSNFDERNVQEMFNWSEVHSERNNFFRNPYFRRFHQILETFLENLVCMKTR